MAKCSYCKEGRAISELYYCFDEKLSKTIFGGKIIIALVIDCPCCNGDWANCLECEKNWEKIKFGKQTEN